MTDYVIKNGDSLSKIASKFGVNLKQLQQANGIKNANLIFAGASIKIPDIESEDSFKLPGWRIEKNSNNAQKLESKSEQVGSSQKEGTDLKSETVIETEQKSPESKPQHTVELSGALTEDDVIDELHKKWADQGGGRLPALPGEVKHGDWGPIMLNHDKEMVCRDSSGQTQDIKGSFKALSDTFELNPDAFTITDNSSGSDHSYLYRKVGVNDKGQPIYKCISMNGDEISTENQYTLEWKDDGTPELVQYDTQNNFGVGLKTKKTNKKAPPVNSNSKQGPFCTAGPSKSTGVVVGLYHDMRGGGSYIVPYAPGEDHPNSRLP